MLDKIMLNRLYHATLQRHTQYITGCFKQQIITKKHNTQAKKPQVIIIFKTMIITVSNLHSNKDDL